AETRDRVIRRRAMLPRRALRVATAVPTLFALAVLSTAVARAEVANRIVATIDGDPITAYQLRKYAKEHGGEHAPEAQVLEALVTEKLLEKESAAQGIAAKDDEIDRYIAQIEERNGMDEAHFRQALTSQGLTLEAYRARVKAEIEKAQLV